MGEEKLAQSAEMGRAAKEPTNCCNGRVGKRALEELVSLVTSLELGEQKSPTGVELLKERAGISRAAKEPTNCCNGRVGKRAMEAMEE